MYNRKASSSVKSNTWGASTGSSSSSSGSKRQVFFSTRDSSRLAWAAPQHWWPKVRNGVRHCWDATRSSWWDDSHDDKLPKWLAQRRRAHPRDLLTKTVTPKQAALFVALCLCLCLTHRGITTYDAQLRTTQSAQTKAQRRLQRNAKVVPNMTGLDTVSPFTIRDFYQGEQHVSETQNVDWVKQYIDFHNSSVYLDQQTYQYTLKPGTRYLKFCWCCPSKRGHGANGKWFIQVKGHQQASKREDVCNNDASLAEELDGIMTAFYVALMTERVLIIDGPNNANNQDRDYNEKHNPMHQALRKLLRPGLIHWAVEVYPESTVHKTIVMGDKRSESYLHDLCVIEPNTLGVELHTSQWFDDEWVWNSRCMQAYLDKIHTSHPHHTSLVHHHEHAAKHPKHNSHLYRPHLYRWAFWTVFKLAGLVIDKADDVRVEAGLNYTKPKKYDEYPRTFGGFFPPPLETPAPTEALPPPPLPPDEHQMQPQLEIPPDYRPYVALQIDEALRPASLFARCTQELVDAAFQMLQDGQTFVDSHVLPPLPHRSLFLSYPLPEKRKQLEERMHQVVHVEPGLPTPAVPDPKAKEMPEWTWEWDQYYQKHTFLLGALAELVIFVEAECIVLTSSGHWSDMAAKISISNLGTLERCTVPLDVCETGNAKQLATALRTLYWSKHHHSIDPTHVIVEGEQQPNSNEAVGVATE